MSREIDGAVGLDLAGAQPVEEAAGKPPAMREQVPV
jgi:hypothetical protein